MFELMLIVYKLADFDHRLHSICFHLPMMTEIPQGIDIPEEFDFEDLFSTDREYNPVYSKAERAVIDVHKEKYMACTSASQKRLYAQNIMFKDIFNHWKSQGIINNKECAKSKSKVRLTYSS